MKTIKDLISQAKQDIHDETTYIDGAVDNSMHSVIKMLRDMNNMNENKIRKYQILTIIMTIGFIISNIYLIYTFNNMDYEKSTTTTITETIQETSGENSSINNIDGTVNNYNTEKSDN